MLAWPRTFHRRRRARTAATARLGEPRADAAGAPLLGHAALRRRVARRRARPRSAWTCRSRRHRRGLRGRRVVDAAWRRSRLLRFGDDVRRAAAGRALLRPGGAAERAGAAIESIARQRPNTAERLPAWPAAAAPADGGRRHARRRATSCWCARAPWCRRTASIVDGRSHVEEAMLTGESAPQLRGPGDRLWAGAINRDNALVMRVTAAGEATRLAAILRLTERAAGGASRGRAHRPIGSRRCSSPRCWCLPPDRRCVLVVRRSGARAGDRVRGAGGVVSVRARAGDAGGARRRRRIAGAPRRGARARRRARDARERHPRRVRQDRHADRRSRPARRLRDGDGHSRERRATDAAAIEACSEHPLARALVAAAPHG